MSDGTILTTDIRPSAPLINMGLRAIFASFAPGSGGNYNLVLTKNFLHNLKIGDANKSDDTIEQVEAPINSIPGTFARMIEGIVTGGDIVVNVEPDAKIGLKDPPPLVMEGGLYMEPRGVLFLGFLDATDQTKMICYTEHPVNIKGNKGWDWAKKSPMAASITFVQSGEGGKVGRDIVAKTLDYLPPTEL